MTSRERAFAGDFRRGDMLNLRCVERAKRNNGAQKDSIRSHLMGYSDGRELNTNDADVEEKLTFQ